MIYLVMNKYWVLSYYNLIIGCHLIVFLVNDQEKAKILDEMPKKQVYQYK